MKHISHVISSVKKHTYWWVFYCCFVWVLFYAIFQSAYLAMEIVIYNTHYWDKLFVQYNSNPTTFFFNIFEYRKEIFPIYTIGNMTLLLLPVILWTVIVSSLSMRFLYFVIKYDCRTNRDSIESTIKKKMKFQILKPISTFASLVCALLILTFSFLSHSFVYLDQVNKRVSSQINYSFEREMNKFSRKRLAHLKENKMVDKYDCDFYLTQAMVFKKKSFVDFLYLVFFAEYPIKKIFATVQLIPLKIGVIFGDTIRDIALFSSNQKTFSIEEVKQILSIDRQKRRMRKRRRPHKDLLPHIKISYHKGKYYSYLVRTRDDVTLLGSTVFECSSSVGIRDLMQFRTLMMIRPQKSQR